MGKFSVNDEPVEKITGDDVRAASQRRREQLKAKRQEYDRKNPMFSTVRLGLSGILALGIGFSVVSNSNAQAAHDEAMLNGRDTISKLEADIDKTELDLTRVPNVEVTQSVINTARDKGAKVAELQHRYSEFKPGTGANDEENKAIDDAIIGLSNELKTYFSTLSVRGSGLNPAQPWYKPATFDPVTKRFGDPDPATYTWEFTNAFSFGVEQKVNVVWLCKGLDGTILAWVTADYDGPSGLFESVVQGVTTAGQQLIPGTPGITAPEALPDRKPGLVTNENGDVLPMPELAPEEERAEANDPAVNSEREGLHNPNLPDPAPAN